MKFVTLTSVADSYQAFFVKEELASEGIECMVINENSANLMQHYGTIGECILIRVLDVDYPTAKQVLEKMKLESATVTCPNCGSANVEYGTGVKNLLTRFLLVFSVLISSTILGRIRLTHRCNDCGYEFRKNAL